MRIGLLRLIVMASLVVVGQQVQAQPLSGVALYHRCHAHLTQERPNDSDPLLTQVKSGALSGPQACSQLLRLGRLTANGQIIASGNNRITGQKVLESMHRVHMSWFNASEYIKEFPFANEVYDNNKQGLLFTRSMFQTAVPFKQAFLEENVFDARREAQADEYYIDFERGTDRWKRDPATVVAYNQYKNWNVELFKKGPLIGFMPARSNIISNKNNVVDLDIHKNHYGKSGILGLNEYLMTNTARRSGTNGGTGMYRRYSQNLVSRFLCREVPLLSAADVQSQVDVNSSLAFKTSSSCMRCHATLDPLAGVIRNLGYDMSTWKLRNQGDYAFSVWFLKTHPTNLAIRQPDFFTSDGVYYRRPTNGTFFIRDMNNNIVNEDFTSLENFATWFSNFDDMYSCVASKYLKYFTGIDAKVHNLASGFADGPQLNRKEIEHRDFAISLGQQLKANQDPLQLIDTIMNSQYYKDSKYGGR